MDAPDVETKATKIESALDEKLAETYELLEAIGHGGMGQVYQARHKLLGVGQERILAGAAKPAG